MGNKSSLRDTILSGQCLAVGHTATVPARVEEPVSSVRQSCSGGSTNNAPFPKMP